MDLPCHIIIQFKIKISQLLVRIYKLSHTVLRKKGRVVKDKHDSHRLTVKSEQNITANLSSWNPREKELTTWCGHPLAIRGAMHSSTKWCNVLWLNAMHSGNK